MRSHTLVLLHGFGVRAFFWDQVRPHFARVFDHVLSPDLQTENITTLLDTTKALLSRRAEEDGAPLSLVGHSLGGVVAAIAARDLGPEQIEQVAVVASPFGERRSVPNPVVRFLLKHHLIPDFLTRPQFFSKHTPKELQKELFEQAVDESPELMSLAFQKRWFHTDFFPEGLFQRSLAIYSEADHIVHPEETKQFAEALGAEIRLFPADRGVAHDDLLVSPTISREVADWIIAFFEGRAVGAAAGS